MKRISPNTRQLTKRKIEEGWASILLRHLNSTGCDYVIGEPHTPRGWADVDVFAMSISGKYPPLYIQLCLDVDPKSPGYEKIWVGRKSHTFKSFGQTIEAVKSKAEKYKKQKKDFSQIILVIQSYLDENDEIYRVPRLRDECKQYKFKKIYLLSPKGQLYGPGKQSKEDPERVSQLL